MNAILLIVSALTVAVPAQTETRVLPTAAKLERFEFEQKHMGMPYKLLFYAADQQTANRMAEATFARIHELDLCLSDYLPDSELNRLSATSPSTSPVKVSDDLWNVLQHARTISAASGGAFDVTIGPMVLLWRRSKRQIELPSAQRIADAKAATGYAGMLLDPTKKTVQLTKPKMRLDVGGIGCGYACDEAMKVLQANGIEHALIDASGDILVSAPPPGKTGWRIGLAKLERPNDPPSRFVNLKNAALTTSGDAYQHVEIDGKRYSHIVDPRTGLGLTESCVVTVVAPRCIDADAWTKPVCVLGPEQGFPLIDKIPGAAAISMRQVDGKIVTSQSSGWQRLDVEIVKPTDQP